MGWSDLRGCSAIEANLVSGILEESGFRTRIVDGAGIEITRDFLAPFDVPVIVQVETSALEAARSIADAEIPPKPVADKTESARTALAATGRRIRYCALTPWAPCGLGLASGYLAGTRRADARPDEHGWNLAGILLCVGWTVLYAFLVVKQVR